jgi:voltage-gated potassium channel
MRRKIYEIIEISDGKNKLSSAYDILMMVVITASIVPLAFKNENLLFLFIDKIAVSIFIIDYILRLATADLKFGNEKITSFFKYPFSFFALVDLISILPSLTTISSSFKLLRLLRMMRAFRVLRIFKTLRYSKSFHIIVNVMKKSSTPLIAVGTLAIAYILITALIIFNVEPDSFNSFFDAIYWATVSLTTMGYGDIYPISFFGRIITMISALFGIAVIALPAGIITAGFMTELSDNDK